MPKPEDPFVSVLPDSLLFRLPHRESITRLAKPSYCQVKLFSRLHLLGDLSYCFTCLLQHDFSTNPETGGVVGTEQHIHSGLNPELEIRRHGTNSNEFSMLPGRPKYELSGFLHSWMTGLPWHSKTCSQIGRPDENVYTGHATDCFEVGESLRGFNLSHETEFIVNLLLFSRNIWNRAIPHGPRNAEKPAFPFGGETNMFR